MATNMDIETLFRVLNKSSNEHECYTRLNNEGRVEVTFYTDEKAHKYVVVGNHFLEIPAKPPTQIMEPAGVDAFGSMGEYL